MVERPSQGASGESLVDTGERIATPPPSEAVVGWLTDFDAPAVGAIRERRLDRRWLPRAVVPGTRVPWSAALAVLAGIGAAIVAIATVEPRLDENVPPAAAPTTSAAPPPPRPAPSVVATERVSLLPDSCAKFYSWRMEKRLEEQGLKLYTPDSAADARLTVPRVHPVGTADPELAEMLAGVAVAECLWLAGTDVASSGVLTAAGEGRDRQLQLAQRRLDELDLTRVEELGGIRYWSETTDDAGVPTGESHFFRDGAWFATHWYGYGPRGYTADIVDMVFADD